MSIQTELQEFYDAHAEKYYQTRNKHRADGAFFLNEIKSSKKKTIKILEFGCGSGRLLAHLKELKGIKINYTGVDISQNLLNFAKKQISGKSAPTNIQATFVCDDILHYVTGLKQESFDFVIGVASFQHIPTDRQRFYLIKNIYRILTYEGKLIMTNRSFSRRFLKKYQKDFLRALRRYVVSFGKSQWNDIMIPRKNGKKISKRFYHIYTLQELQKFASLSGFIIEKNYYIKKGIASPSWKESENTLIVARKNIFVE